MFRISLSILSLTLAACASTPKGPTAAREPSSKTGPPAADAKECQQSLLGTKKR